MSEITRQYCQRYGVTGIALSNVPGVVGSAQSVCKLGIDFDDGFHVQFKLPGEQALWSQQVVELKASGEVRLINGSKAGEELEADLLKFFKGIETRLATIRHEQEVQSITFLGNSFILNGKTVFDVVDDTGGRLAIVMHKGDKRQPAMMLASSLLDGLYNGSIKLI